MSPRKKNVHIVKNWPKPKKGKLYKGIIRKVDTNTTRAHLVIENIDPTQLGRTHEIDLPLPIRPNRYHKTCYFLMTCGIDATSNGISVDFDQIIGITVGMRFGAVAQDGSQQVDFVRIKDSPDTQPDAMFEESGEEDNQSQSEPAEHENPKHF
ncbi:MAG: hypothetical protein ACYS74_03195 [Planctomycetota bacterium]|jgi:hypothetical protein